MSGWEASFSSSRSWRSLWSRPEWDWPRTTRRLDCEWAPRAPHAAVGDFVSLRRLRRFVSDLPVPASRGQQRWDGPWPRASTSCRGAAASPLGFARPALWSWRWPALAARRACRNFCSRRAAVSRLPDRALPPRPERHSHASRASAGSRSCCAPLARIWIRVLLGNDVARAMSGERRCARASSSRASRRLVALRRT
jgi:hypothetical protein